MAKIKKEEGMKFVFYFVLCIVLAVIAINVIAALWPLLPFLLIAGIVLLIIRKLMK